jgi:hypothetical protein
MHHLRSKIDPNAPGHAYATPAGASVRTPRTRSSVRRRQMRGHDVVPLRIWLERGTLYSRNGPVTVRPPHFLGDRLYPRPLGPLTRAHLTADPSRVTQLSLSCPLILSGPLPNGPFVLISGWETWAVVTELAAAPIPRLRLHAWRIKCSASAAMELAAWTIGLLIGRRPHVPRGVLARVISFYLRPSNDPGHRRRVTLATDLIGVSRQALPRLEPSVHWPKPRRGSHSAQQRRSQVREPRRPTRPRRG